MSTELKVISGSEDDEYISGGATNVPSHSFADDSELGEFAVFSVTNDATESKELF